MPRPPGATSDSMRSKETRAPRDQLQETPFPYQEGIKASRKRHGGIDSTARRGQMAPSNFRARSLRAAPVISLCLERIKSICSHSSAAAKAVLARRSLGQYVSIQPRRNHHTMSTRGAHRSASTSLFKPLERSSRCRGHANIRRPGHSPFHTANIREDFSPEFQVPSGTRASATPAAGVHDPGDFGPGGPEKGGAI